MRRSRKPLSVQADRGFESHPLRHLPSLKRSPNPAAAELSVEEGIMKTLGLAMGDILSYEVGGRKFEAPALRLVAGEPAETGDA